MKKIHELLEDLDVTGIDINEVEMSKEEKNKILELTLNKGNLSNKKSTRKKLLLPLAATLTLILSFAVVFAQGGFSNIYYNLFGENIKYVNEMGTVINKSYTDNQVTLNVANMLGDENAFYIIYELIKENGESFNSDYVAFDSVRLDFEGSGGYTWYQVEDDNKNDNKATFILSGNTKKKITGDELTLLVKDFTEYSIKEPINGFKPYDFLLNNTDYINQDLLAPNKILPWKYANIFVEDNFYDINVENIGFAEDKLCIRFASVDAEKNSIGNIYFVNSNNPENIKYSESVLKDEKDGVKYDYYIFDISSMEELKNYELKYEIVSKLGTTLGNWEVSFKADYKNTTETININKITEINEKKYTVKNIKISPIALNVEMKNNLVDTFEDSSHNLNDSVSVIMVDGSTPEISSMGTSTNSFSASINIMFQKPIDTTLIKKIIIGSLEVEL